MCFLFTEVALESRSDSKLWQTPADDKAAWQGLRERQRTTKNPISHFGLFALLLGALGFQVDLLSAAVALSTGGFGPDFDHLTLLVHLEQDWLADVGFGESFRQPLRLQAGLIQQQAGGAIGWSAKGNPGSISHGMVPGGRPTVFTYRLMPCLTLPPCAAVTKPLCSPPSRRNESVRWQHALAGSP
jgi:hypothetical protein